MKRKKIILSVAIALSLFVGTISTTSYAAEESQNSSISSTVDSNNKLNTFKVQGKAELQLIGQYDNLDNTEISKLKDLQKRYPKKVELIKNSEKSYVIKLHYPASGNSVLVNGQAAKLDSEGNYTYESKSENNTIQLKTKNGNVLQSKTVNVSDSNDLIAAISFDKFFSNMDKNSDMTNTTNMTNMANNMANMTNATDMTMSMAATYYPGQTYYGEPVYEGDHVHCNRFNGPDSDHTYWSQASANGVIDFIGSDCDNDLQYWGCTEPNDTVCQGLNYDPTDCSEYNSWPVTAWFRN